MQNITSEVVLVTKNDNYTFDLIEWINYYTKLGFDHIMIYDNMSKINIKTICKNFKNVTYKYLKGWPDQYNLYTNHYKQSTYDYVYFADDDEFLWINPVYKNINEFITKKTTELNSDIIAIFWQKMASNPVINTRNNSEELTQVKCFKFKQLIENDSWCKCIYKTKITSISKILTHNVDSNDYYNIVDVNKINIFQGNISINNIYCCCKRLEYNLSNDDAVIFHYYYKSWEEFYKKMRQPHIALNKTYKEEFPHLQFETVDNYINLLYNDGYSIYDNRISEFLYGK